MLSDPLSVKVAALCILGVLRIFAGLCPLAFSSTIKTFGERRVQVATSLALCLGGGVLLASCMLHMIPEVRESFGVLQLNFTFPVPEFIVCCGFFFVYTVEELVQSFTRVAPRSMEAEMRINGKVGPIPSGVTQILTIETPRDISRHLLVLSALSLHSALEGLALGLQPNPRAVWMLFIAVSAHAVAVLFSIGLQLVSAGVPDLQVVLAMSVLALSSPLGGSLGLVATADGEQAHAGVVITLQGLAAGAVLYVTFFEVLDREKKKGGFIRLFMVMLGFGIMAGFQTIGAHNHIQRNFITTKNSTRKS